MSNNNNYTGTKQLTQHQQWVWDRLAKLGITNRVTEFIDTETEKVIAQGYDVYPMDVIDHTFKEGLKRAGITDSTEFETGEVIALAYLLGMLLGHEINKYKAKDLLNAKAK